LTSKQRILATLNGETSDHTPLTTWCFGFPAPEHLRWKTNGKEVPFWYTKRFILHPMDAIFPDTPWEGLETMIDEWKKYK